MQFLEAEVIELTRTVWETVLAMGIEPAEDDRHPPDGEETVSACVHISGGWNGSVILSCPSTLGIAIAAAMFELEHDEVDDELLHDAVGEVANMIGGNVKGLVPGPSQLSLPTVATGLHTRLAVPGSHPVTRVGFRSECQPVRVVLTEVNDTAADGGASADTVETGRQDPASVA
jgi:chemotaxis protein CheX